MLKYNFDCHGHEELEDMRFGGRIVKQCMMAFNRHVRESVQIKIEKTGRH